jgi:hypothetical protein
MVLEETYATSTTVSATELRGERHGAGLRRKEMNYVHPRPVRTKFSLPPDVRERLKLPTRLDEEEEELHSQLYSGTANVKDGMPHGGEYSILGASGSWVNPNGHAFIHKHHGRDREAAWAQARQAVNSVDNKRRKSDQQSAKKASPMPDYSGIFSSASAPGLLSTIRSSTPTEKSARLGASATSLRPGTVGSLMSSTRSGDPNHPLPKLYHSDREHIGMELVRQKVGWNYTGERPKPGPVIKPKVAAPKLKMSAEPWTPPKGWTF